MYTLCFSIEVITCYALNNGYNQVFLYIVIKRDPMNYYAKSYDYVTNMFSTQIAYVTYLQYNTSEDKSLFF